MDKVEQIRESQEFAWKERLVHFLIPRLTGSEAEKETTMEMVWAGIHQAHNEGVKDCAYILGQMVERTEGDRRVVLKIAHDALTELHRRNAKDGSA